MEQFLYHEAHLLDNYLYEEWRDLWVEDGLYWVPGEEANREGMGSLSIIRDEGRKRIDVRVAQLLTDIRYSQVPRSVVRRVVSNVMILGGSDDEVSAEAAFVVHEFRRDNLVPWSGTTRYALTKVKDGFRIKTKSVFLVNRGWAFFRPYPF